MNWGFHPLSEVDFFFTASMEPSPGSSCLCPRWLEVFDCSPWCVNNVQRARKESLDIEVFDIRNRNNF